MLNNEQVSLLISAIGHMKDETHTKPTTHDNILNRRISASEIVVRNAYLDRLERLIRTLNT